MVPFVDRVAARQWIGPEAVGLTVLILDAANMDRADPYQVQCF